jgi:hypothetical protein
MNDAAFKRLAEWAKAYGELPVAVTQNQVRDGYKLSHVAFLSRL